MEAYYKTLLCQTTNLYKGDRAAAQAFVEDMIVSLQKASPNAGINFPANLTAVIDAMVAGDCGKAAQLLASANGSSNTISNDNFNHQFVIPYTKFMLEPVLNRLTDWRCDCALSVVGQAYSAICPADHFAYGSRIY